MAALLPSSSDPLVPPPTRLMASGGCEEYQRQDFGPIGSNSLGRLPPPDASFLRAPPPPAATALAPAPRIAPPPADLSTIKPVVHNFRLGQRVKVRNASDAAWMLGTVTRLHPVVKVRPEGFEEDYPWAEIEETSEAVRAPPGLTAAAILGDCDEDTDYSQPKQPPPPQPLLSACEPPRFRAYLDEASGPSAALKAAPPPPPAELLPPPPPPPPMLPQGALPPVAVATTSGVPGPPLLPSREETMPVAAIAASTSVPGPPPRPRPEGTMPVAAIAASTSVPGPPPRPRPEGTMPVAAAVAAAGVPAPPPLPPPEDRQLAIARDQPRWIVDKEGGLYCLLCSQWADSGHLGSKKHLKRELNPEWYLWDEEQEANAICPRADVVTRLEQSASWISAPPAGQMSLSLSSTTASSSSSVAVSSKPCSYCGEAALDKTVEGTKAKYCADCWLWWDQTNGGPSSAGRSVPAGLPRQPQLTAPPIPGPPPFQAPAATAPAVASRPGGLALGGYGGPPPPPPPSRQREETAQSAPPREAQPPAASRWPAFGNLQPSAAAVPPPPAKLQASSAMNWLDRVEGSAPAEKPPADLEKLAAPDESSDEEVFV